MKADKGKTLVLFSAKGGVGKTITTLNLAGIFSTLRKKVLIIDADTASGAISFALNKNNKYSIYDLIEDFKKNAHHEIKDYVTKYSEYIDFLAAPKDPRQATKIDARYIELVIERATSAYDIVLIDTNHYLSELNLLILDKADKILFVATNESLHIKNLRSLINIFNELNIKKYKVLLNNSVVPKQKGYYSLYDIRTIINANIDFVISSKMHIKTMEKYLVDGEIVTLKRRASLNNDYSVLVSIAADALKGGGQNEQK